MHFRFILTTALTLLLAVPAGYSKTASKKPATKKASTASPAPQKPVATKPATQIASVAKELVRVLIEAGDRFAEGEYDKAISGYMKLIQVAPKSPEGYMGLGRIALLRGDHKAAIGYFARAVGLVPRSADAHFELGSSQLSMGNVSEAVKELTRASDLDPNRPEIQYRLSQARALIDATKASMPDRDRNALPSALTNMDDNNSSGIDQSSEVSMVFRLITSGRVEEAIAQGLNALKAQPDNASLQYQLGLMYKVTGDIDKAIDTFEQAIKNDPDHTQALAQLTSLYLSRNQVDKAREEAQLWVKADPVNPTAQFSLAWTYIVARSFRQALPCLRTAAQLDPRNAEILNHLGLTLRELGLNDEAKTMFDRAMAINPEAQSPRLNLLMVELYDGNVRKAYDMIQPLLVVQPVSIRVQSVSALINARLGNFDKAKKQALDVLKRVPDQPLASLALAEANTKTGNFEEAATILETSLKSQPNNAFLLNGLAETFLSQGKVDRAIEYAQRAYKIAPDKFKIGKTLITTLAQEHRIDEALTILKDMRLRGIETNRLTLLEGEILEGSKDADAALKFYLELMAKQPDNDLVAIKAAQLYLNLKKPKNAQSILEAVLARSPSNELAHLTMAKLQWSNKKYDRAYTEANAATRTTDGEIAVDALAIAARSSFKLKRYEEAAQEFRSLRSQRELSGEDLVMLARSLKEIKLPDEATQVLAVASQIQPQSREFKAELKRLTNSLQ